MLTKTIPSYLYKQYDDDDTLQAFVDVFNSMAQEYVDWFNELGLPIYTGRGSLVDGTLLDWVATNLYGFPRPVLPFGDQESDGPLNSMALNAIVLDGSFSRDPANVFTTNDDVYRRCLTWMFFKGDGKEFTIRWLKRRVARFLTGKNGRAGETDQTYRISVTFGPDPKRVNINVLTTLLTVIDGPLNATPFDATTLNAGAFSAQTFKQYKLAPVFKAAMDAGVLEVPFTYDFVVTV